MKRKRKILLVIVIALVLYTALEAELILPVVGGKDKVVILYYDPFNLPLNTSGYRTVINFAKSNHFNTLMLVVYAYGHTLFNESEIAFFSSFAESNDITFVPSYYIVSLQDTINATGFSWVNLDMESINVRFQSYFYDKIASEVKLVSVTSPYGQNLPYQPGMNIVETYYDSPAFWYYQLWFYHSSIVCSVNAHSATSQATFSDEFNYCLDHSRGVMVFDYWNLTKANFTVPDSNS